MASTMDLTIEEVWEVVERTEAKLAEVEKAATLSAQGREIAKLNHELDDMANENIALEATAKAAEAKRAEYRKALEGLCDKLDVIVEDKGYKRAWEIAFVHGEAYHGPTWAEEYDVARQALKDGE